MIQIYAVSDGNKHFSSAIEEYTKRLGKNCQIHYLKPSKKDTVSEIIKQESANIQKLLKQKSAYKVLLDIESKVLSTMEFYKFIEKEKQKQTDIIFLIGGAYGVTDQIKKSFDLSLSLSSMTFPHSMALLLLVEQLYRVQSISQGKKYHH